VRAISRIASPRGDALQGRACASLDKQTFAFGGEQDESRDGFRALLLRDVSELRASCGKECVVPAAQVCDEKLAVLEAEEAQPRQPLDEIRQLDSRGPAPEGRTLDLLRRGDLVLLELAVGHFVGPGPQRDFREFDRVHPELHPTAQSLV